MQLLIILALLMYGGKSGAQNILQEVKPVIESFGDEKMKEALKSAEEISSVLSVVGNLSSAANAAATDGADSGAQSAAAFGQNADASSETAAPSPIAFPLKPINDIADRDIAYSLSKYINA